MGLDYPYSEKALISCAVTAQVICIFVSAYAKGRFSHNEAPLSLMFQVHLINAIRFEGIEQVQSVIQDYNPDVNQADQVTY